MIWEELSRSQQAILASLREKISGYTNAFDGLVRGGLIDAVTTETTAFGREVLEDAELRGYLIWRHKGYKRA